MDKKLGNIIFNLRKEKGLTQEDLAELLKVSRQTISKWENDSVQPSPDNINLLCEKLEVTREVLFNETACTSDSSTNKNGNINSVRKRVDIYLICIIIFSILIVGMITLTALLGIITFTSNTGDLYDNSDSINKYVFYISLVVTLKLVVVDLILFIVKLKNVKANKM